MLKFIHIADVHLDTTFLSRSERVRKTLRVAIRTAFERAVSRAIDEKVTGMLIAGDLFDGSRLSFGTERFLIEQLFRLDAAGIPCFYATGNHDPGGGSSRVMRMKLPDSFVLFGQARPSAVDIMEGDTVVARIVGAGHESEAETRNLATAFPKSEAGIPTIGLLHALVTSASGMERHDRYAPCALEDLRSKGYAYWALGHVHERQEVDSDSRIQYPGNIQGRTPKERGRRGGLLVTIDRAAAPTASTVPRVSTKFLALSSVDWDDVVVDELDEIADAARLERRIRACCDEAFARQPDVVDRMVRIVLAGPTPLATDLLRSEYLADIAADLKSSLGTLDVEVICRGIRPPIDLQEYRDGQHVLGEVLALLDEVAVSDDLIDELAPDPIADIDASATDRNAYLRSLLDEMGAEAAARLLVEDK